MNATLIQVRNSINGLIYFKGDKIMEVKALRPMEIEPWLLYKHYAKRTPSSIMYGFGMILDNKIEGVCTFSSPIARFKKFNYKIMELTRLVINEGLGKNVLSQFLGKALKTIDKPYIIVSYADPNMGHNGYIYQATNWIYTGLSAVEHKHFIDGVEIHSRTLNARYGTRSPSKLREMGLDITIETQKAKHRYFMTTGTKRDKKNQKREILERYNQSPYPKADNKRYECDFDPDQKFDKWSDIF